MYANAVETLKPLGETDRDAVLRVFGRSGIGFEWSGDELRLQQEAVDENDGDDVGLSIELRLSFDRDGALRDVAAVLLSYDGKKWGDLDDRGDG